MPKYKKTPSMYPSYHIHTQRTHIRIGFLLIERKNEKYLFYPQRYKTLPLTLNGAQNPRIRDVITRLLCVYISMWLQFTSLGGSSFLFHLATVCDATCIICESFSSLITTPYPNWTCFRCKNFVFCAIGFASSASGIYDDGLLI